MRLHSRAGRTLAVPLLAMAGVTAWAAPAWAAPPANDNKANAVVLPLGGTASGTTVEATTEAGETAPACFHNGVGGTTVWYSVTTDADTSGLNFALSSPTDLGVYVFEATGTTLLGCADEKGGNETEALTIAATANTTYLVSVDRYQPGEEGPFDLSVSESAPPPPPPSGTGPVTSDPAILDFGTTAVGSETPTQQVVLVNGGTDSVEVTVVDFAPDADEFPFHGTTCALTDFGFLVPVEGCSFTFSYLPLNAGPSSAVVTWQYTNVDGMPQQFTSTLQGEGVDQEPPPEVPEVPMTLLLPGSTLLLGVGVYLVRRRTRTVAPLEG